MVRVQAKANELSSQRDEFGDSRRFSEATDASAELLCCLCACKDGSTGRWTQQFQVMRYRTSVCARAESIAISQRNANYI